VRITRASARRQGDFEGRNFLPAPRAVFNRLPEGLDTTNTPQKKKARQ